MHALDLFAEFSTTPDLPISHRHAKNHRAFEETDIKIESWTLGELEAAIKIARDLLGYHWAIEYRHQQGSTGGPVFIKPKPLETYNDARREAIAELKRRLRTNYSERPASLLKVIETAIQEIK